MERAGGVAGTDIVRLRTGPGRGNDKNPRHRLLWGDWMRPARPTFAFYSGKTLKKREPLDILLCRASSRSLQTMYA